MLNLEPSHPLFSTSCFPNSCGFSSVEAPSSLHNLPRFPRITPSNTSLSPLPSHSPLNTPSFAHSSGGAPTSATSPPSSTSTLSKSATVLSLCATTMSVHPANSSRIDCWMSASVR